MAQGICDTLKTRLSFADTRRTCRIAPSFIGRGNVESTAIGFVRDGEGVTGYLPTLVRRDKCASVYLKPAQAPC